MSGEDLTYEELCKRVEARDLGKCRYEISADQRCLKESGEKYSRVCRRNREAPDSMRNLELRCWEHIPAWEPKGNK